MLNVEKLDKDIKELSASRASQELDRMIKLHEDGLKNADEAVKRYIRDIAITPGKATDYTTDNANIQLIVRHTVALKHLRKLRKQLSSDKKEE